MQNKQYLLELLNGLDDDVSALVDKMPCSCGLFTVDMDNDHHVDVGLFLVLAHLYLYPEKNTTLIPAKEYY